MMASLNRPSSVAVDQTGRLYIADTYNGRIRMVGADGIISTVAGNGTDGYFNDGGPATSTSLPATYSLAVDSAGDIYLSDYGRVRKVTNGIINTVAGPGSLGYTDDALLTLFWRIAVDPARNIGVVSWMGVVRLLVPQNTKPVLSVRLNHANNFTAGQSGSYSVVVSNALNAAGYVLPTSGTVTVTEFLPPGLTITGMSGSGWNCASGSCTRSDALAGGDSYPPITVTVSVSASVPPQVINQVAVSGGGSFASADSDATTFGSAST